MKAALGAAARWKRRRTPPAEMTRWQRLASNCADVPASGHVYVCLSSSSLESRRASSRVGRQQRRKKKTRRIVSQLANSKDEMGERIALSSLSRAWQNRHSPPQLARYSSRKRQGRKGGLEGQHPKGAAFVFRAQSERALLRCNSACKPVGVRCCLSAPLEGYASLIGGCFLFLFRFYVRASRLR